MSRRNVLKPSGMDVTNTDLDYLIDAGSINLDAPPTANSSLGSNVEKRSNFDNKEMNKTFSKFGQGKTPV